MIEVGLWGPYSLLGRDNISKGEKGPYSCRGRRRTGPQNKYMLKRFAGISCCALVCSLAGCNKADRDQANAQGERAKQQTNDDIARAQAGAKKLGSAAKSEAKKLGDDIHQAVNNTGTSGTVGASEKLQQASETAKESASVAGQKLSKAALIAQIKTKLASDIGLSSATDVKVDVAGTIATLTGTVKSDDDRKRAEKSASEVNGVTKVINELQLQGQ